MIKCNLCGHKQFEQYHLKEDITILQCKNCYLGFLNPTIPMPKYGKDYFRKYTCGKKSYLQKQESKALSSKHFLNLLTQRLFFSKDDSKALRPRLLEIGCAAGFFLKEAKKLGFIPEGVEVSDWARKYAKNKGFKVYKNIPKRGKYDAIVMLNTIEHLQDPKGALKKVLKLLTKNSSLLITTPNNFPKFKYICKEHRFYFDTRTIAKLLQDTGFNIVHFRCPYLTRKIDSTITNVKFKKKLVKNPFTTLVYKTVKKFDNTRFGTTMEIIATKR